MLLRCDRSCPRHGCRQALIATIMADELHTERQGDYLLLALDHRAQGNALTAAMCVAGLEALSTAQRDPDIRAVILTGKGGQFCRGVHDLAACAALHDWVLALRDCDPLVIAVVEGLAQGAGAALALAADLRVATADALFLLSDPLARDADIGGAQWMAAKSLPEAIVVQALLPGAGLSGERLYALGVVNRLCTAGGGLPAAIALADAAAALAPRRKPLLHIGDGLPLHAHLDRQIALAAGARRADDTTSRHDGHGHHGWDERRRPGWQAVKAAK